MLMDYLRRFGLLFSTHLLLLMLLETKTICGDVPPHYWETPYSQPYFDNSSRREVTATVGQAALLHCRVRNLGDRAANVFGDSGRHQFCYPIGKDNMSVWFSLLFYYILVPKMSSNRRREFSFREEEIIEVLMADNSDDEDVSRAKILGNSELFIKSGSDINLTCLAMQSPIPPSFIYWYKGKRVMNYSQRGGINVITERSTRTSKLLIAKATPSDSGNYTCSPSSSDSASVVVHVINGEHPAAMQHGNSSANRLSTTLHGILYRIAKHTFTALAASINTVTTTKPTLLPSDVEFLLSSSSNEKESLLKQRIAWFILLLRRMLQRLLLAATTTNWCIVAVGWLLSKWTLQCSHGQHKQQSHRWSWWHWRVWFRNGGATASLIR
ncbi:uncharacterized protein dpr4 [Eurosta solidaginis]|uniref:uncharacterized protein dpr4 n=1 Tax=Eurosta solidaginis TaxID=178769 RepID=UPI0035310575